MSVIIAALSWISVSGQIDNNGCVGAGFGIDAGLYSNTIEFGDGTPAAGSRDWFFSPGASLGTIDESNTNTIRALLQGGGNPAYVSRMNSNYSEVVSGKLLIDAVFARDHFGGSGFTDPTSYTSASKNGDDPMNWAGGTSNVLGKNDLIDVAGHMLRDGPNFDSDLWFYGLINRAEPGGAAYMDFEFFAKKLSYTEGVGFSSGGSNLGHTAFEFDAGGNITKIGDFIFNVSLVNGGIEAQVELRIWVKRSDYQTLVPARFNWGSNFDGAFSGSLYGYANIGPINAANTCGIVNLVGQEPNAPPWGTMGTKDNNYQTKYVSYSVVEMGLNLTAFGIDNAVLLGGNQCDFALESFIVKTRASASFTSQLKDFAGPYTWVKPMVSVVQKTPGSLSCLNPTQVISAYPRRTDVSYLWTTSTGQILTDPTKDSVIIGKPGTYYLQVTLQNGCLIPVASISVDIDPTKPLFNEHQATSTVACNGNDGSIDLTVSGATSPYSYQWIKDGSPSVISTIQDPVGLSPGNYSVTVTDAIGCTKTKSGIAVNARTPATISFTPVHVNCFGDNTGSITTIVTGKSPFTYKWSNGAITKDIAGLRAGMYRFTLTDADKCTKVDSVFITEPPILALSTTTVLDTDPSPATGNGSIDLTVTGGTSPYTYDWSHNGAQDPDTDPQDLSGLIAGTYTVTVTDTKGCTRTGTAIVYQHEICNDGIDNDNNGLTDCNDASCIPGTAGPVNVSADPVCVGDPNVLYSVTPVNADYYEWIVPEGANIVSGQGTPSLTVNWTAKSNANVCVRTYLYSCFNSQLSCFNVTVQDVPPVPGKIIVID